MLLLFLETYDKYSNSIIDDIANGTVSNPLSNTKITLNKPNQKRAFGLKKLLGAPLFWEKILPNLQVISCWGEASAEMNAKK